jgi:hypothetical protein
MKSRALYKYPEINFHPINFINKKIEAEKNNAIGIPVFVIMYNTGIASLTVGLSLHQNISYLILAISTILTMTILVLVLNVTKLKTLIWFFLISSLVNTILLFYQILMLK